VFTKKFDRLTSVHQHARLVIDDHLNPFAKESIIVNTETRRREAGTTVLPCSSNVPRFVLTPLFSTKSEHFTAATLLERTQ
jgi:hypothetical protein